MGKKVYLDYKYKMDCEQQINYVSYIMNNNTTRVINNGYISSTSDDGDDIYCYSDINGTVCKQLTIS
jgi:hypothetical protein